MERPRLDLLAVAAALLAVSVLGGYLAIMRDQQEDPAAVALAGLVLGAAAAAYGAVRSSPWWAASLWRASGVLGLLGLLAILSIGVPILVASALAGIAALRAPARGATTAG